MKKFVLCFFMGGFLYGLLAEAAINRPKNSPEVSKYKSKIRQVVMKKRGAVQNCYGKALEKNPELKGKMVLQWVIQGSGKVKQAKIRRSQLKSKGLRKCVLRQAKKWKFPKTPKGKTIRVAYPFRFGEKATARN